MGHAEAAKLLQQTLDEEKAADQKLSGLAESGINQSAAEAAHPDEDDEPAAASGAKKRSSKRSQVTPVQGSPSTRTSMPSSADTCATWRLPVVAAEDVRLQAGGGGDSRARRAADGSGRGRRRAAANPRHRSRLNTRHSRDSRNGRVADRRAGDRPERPPRRHRAAASASAALSQPRGGHAVLSDPPSRVPRSSSTAATCRCTPNGATALPRSRRLPTPACSAAIHMRRSPTIRTD